jgi:hypothetical protein
MKKMNTPHIRMMTLLALVGLTFLTVIACVASSAITAIPTPFIQTIENTRVVTQVVTQDVTEMVTQIVEVPVTETPGPIVTAAPSPNPNAPADESGLPHATLPAHADCLYGPADWFEYKTSFSAGQLLDVVGKSDDSN